jgi:DNA-binding MarR family transcriptional regulator
MSASKLRIYHRLVFAAHQIQKSADRRLLAAADITTAQAAVLSVVSRGCEVTQREVARQLGLNESAVTAMTNRLLNMGLLDKKRNEDDARVWHLYLSSDGRAIHTMLAKPFGEINRTLESVLSAAEIEKLADYLGRIGDAFGGD